MTPEEIKQKKIQLLLCRIEMLNLQGQLQVEEIAKQIDTLEKSVLPPQN